MRTTKRSLLAQVEAAMDGSPASSASLVSPGANGGCFSLGCAGGRSPNGGPRSDRWKVFAISIEIDTVPVAEQQFSIWLTTNPPCPSRIVESGGCGLGMSRGVGKAMNTPILRTAVGYDVRLTQDPWCAILFVLAPRIARSSPSSQKSSDQEGRMSHLQPISRGNQTRGDGFFLCTAVSVAGALLGTRSTRRMGRR